MPGRLTQVDPRDEQGDWNTQLSLFGRPSVFHRVEWARVLCESYGYRPHYLVWKERDNVAALLPLMEVDSLVTGRRGVSLPFSDHCDPVLGAEVNRHTLFSAAVEYAKRRGWRYLHFHGGRNLFGSATPSVRYVGHRLPLAEDIALQRARLADSTGRNIRKAMRLGVEIDIGTTSAALNDLYELHCLTRKRQRLPAQPLHFFRAIHRHMLSNNLGHIVRARHDGRAVGAAMFFHLGGQVLFKFGASDRRHQHLRMNDLVLWSSIEWSAHNGYRTFEFGRTDALNSGLRRFKSGWGADEYDICYYRYDVKRKRFVEESFGRLGAVMKPAFSRLPIPVARLVGTLIYRHFG